MWDALQVFAQTPSSATETTEKLALKTKKTKTPHTVTVAAAGYRTASAAVQLEAGKTVRATVKVQRL